MSFSSLRTKVLIPVAIMILAVILVALAVVNQVVRRQVLANISHDLQTSRRVFHELQGHELDLLTEKSWVIAQAPHLKAAVDTGDSTTVQRVAGEMFGTLGSDILIIAGRQKQILAQNGSSRLYRWTAALDSFFAEDTGFESKSGLLAANGSFYRIIGVPILTSDEIAGVYLLGHVVTGKLIDQTYLAALKALVECEVVFQYQSRPVVATLPVAHLPSPHNDASSAFELTLAGEAFLAQTAGRHGNYLLLKSVDRAFQRIMRPIERTILFVGLFGILAAILISVYISYGIVTPVGKLVRATEKITAGDYDYQIDIRSQDEIGQLSVKFDQMRATLKQKIAQLNERNLELEAALRKLEAAQQELVRSERLAATGKITAQLSHELNNPIHNIQSCLEAVRRKMTGGETVREFVDLAYDEVLRIGQLTRQMLDFYRPYAARKERINVNSIVEEVLKSSETTSLNGKIDLVKRLSPDVAEISASPDQLKQVFLNLVLNAVDAMPNGGQLKVSTHMDDAFAYVAFEDNGCGIAAENKDKIFDAFFTTKVQTNGVGLGLSVSYGIVQSHDGSIRVESEPGKGSKFTVQLPLDRDKHA